MKITNKVVYESLDKLFAESPVYELHGHDKWVIFSDLHMGDGGSTDDFKMNAELFKVALKEYYLKNQFSLILNGDVEELQRFSLRKIMYHWRSIYQVFDEFHQKTRLLKTIGNHDLRLGVLKESPFPYKLLEAFRFSYKEEFLFFFHGHQASKKFQRHNRFIGLALKYFANPLGIKNYSVSHSSMKQYKIEKRVYHYSAYRKVVSIIGHTHRPLFESLHKVERLRYQIEQLCREMALGSQESTEALAEAIQAAKSDLKKYYRKNKATSYRSYVYNTLFHIPSLFNSGCVIGKRGMTGLEIVDGMIRLVHWFDERTSKKYLHETGYEPERLAGTDFYRMVINEESLDYVFARIRLLS